MGVRPVLISFFVASRARQAFQRVRPYPPAHPVPAYPPCGVLPAMTQIQQPGEGTLWPAHLIEINVGGGAQAYDKLPIELHKAMHTYYHKEPDEEPHKDIK